MASALFSDSTYTVKGLVEAIDKGEVALPDIQRPFVWTPTKARNLFDSMYRGYSVGHLLFWQSGAEPGARQIGTDAKQLAPSLAVFSILATLSMLIFKQFGVGLAAAI